MDDDTQAKCRVVAEFEGIRPKSCKAIPLKATGLCNVHRRSFPHDTDGPDYPHDLNATMRAARRLPEDCDLMVGMRGEAWIEERDGGSLEDDTYQFHRDDPARAAFECIYQFAAQRKEKPHTIIGPIRVKP